jgi:DNA-binding IclR family transcriptional regulator
MRSIGLTTMEISTKCKIPYSSAFNILQTMERYGYAKRDQGTGKYSLGLKLLSLGHGKNIQLNARRAVALSLEKLAKQTGLTGHLAILDNNAAVYIDKREGDSYIKINSWIGKRNLLHCTAVGKALIAYKSEREIRDLCDKTLVKRTKKTITSFKKLMLELAEVCKCGYAVDDEEDEVSGRCVASPIFNASGGVVAAIGVAGIVTQLPDERLKALGAAVRKCAADISQQFRNGQTKKVW